MGKEILTLRDKIDQYEMKKDEMMEASSGLTDKILSLTKNTKKMELAFSDTQKTLDTLQVKIRKNDDIY